MTMSGMQRSRNYIDTSKYSNKLSNNIASNHISVLRFDYQGNFIDKRFITQDTCKDMNLNYCAVLNASKVNSKMSSYLGYIWIREKDFSKAELQRKVNIRKQFNTKETYLDSIKKPIVQIDINAKRIVKIYPSIVSIEEEGDFDSTSISNVINGRQQTHKNYIWVEYQEDIEYSERYIDSLIERKLSKIKNRPKKVVKYSAKTGLPIAEYNSIAQASKENNISYTTITKMINGEKTGFPDFIFKLKGDDLGSINKSEILLFDLNNVKKKIIQINIETQKIVKIYPSISSVTRDGHNRVNVSNAINGKLKTYKNCIWIEHKKGIKYNSDYIASLIDEKVSKNKKAI